MNHEAIETRNAETVTISCAEYELLKAENTRSSAASSPFDQAKEEWVVPLLPATAPMIAAISKRIN